MPIPAGPSPSPSVEWAPTRAQVADYVPWRTLTRAESSIVESDDDYEATFSTTTRPPGDAVDRLIGNAAARILARVGTLAESLQDAARTVCCLLVGSWIERSWPEDQDSQTRADALAKEAELLLDELVEANEATSGTGEYGLDIAPVWSFPLPDCRWDDASRW